MTSWPVCYRVDPCAVCSCSPSRAHHRATLRSRIFQAHLVHFQVSSTGVYPARRVSPDHNTKTSVLLVVAGVLTAECREFWQLLLCQGILMGFACGMIYGSLPPIVSQWFEKRRSLAFGIVAAGSALGGTVIPIGARNLIELIGYVGES